VAKGGGSALDGKSAPPATALTTKEARMASSRRDATANRPSPVTPTPRGGIIHPVQSAGALTAALDYAHRGWPVLPLHWPIDGHCSCGQADCKSPAGHPHTEHGLDDATTDSDTIRKWWGRWPKANIGIVMGSGLLCLDVDPRDGGEDSLRDLERDVGDLRDTVTMLTGHGERLLLAVTGEFQSSIHLLGPGLRIRCDGDYTVAPPSRHVSGGLYQWKSGHGPDELRLAPLPQTFAERLAEVARVRAFFAALFPLLDENHRIELRLLRPGTQQGGFRWFTHDTEDALETAQGGSRGGLEAFFGVAARGPKETGKKHALRYLNAVYVDFDVGKGYTDETARETIDGLDPSPSVVVKSGGGYHLYWLLREPAFFGEWRCRELCPDCRKKKSGKCRRCRTCMAKKNPTHIPAEMDKLEGIMRGLVDKLGLDATWDATRVLRVPGTLNHKPGREPLAVEILRFDPDHRHVLDALASQFYRPRRDAESEPGGGGDGPEAQARAERLAEPRDEAGEAASMVAKMLEPHHLADLRRSGLNDETVVELRFFSAGAQTVKRLLGFRRSVGPGMVIPYPDLSEGFVRVRLDHPPAEQQGEAKRYRQPTGTENKAYIPARAREAIAKPKEPLIITEGEKKAAKADQEGFPCIGIGGVWSFEHGQGKGLIPDLAEVVWKQRRVYLIYDSDYHGNRNVQHAARHLAWELTGRGALVFVVGLPRGEAEGKVGLDDFLVANGERALRGLLSFDTAALIDTRVAVKGGAWMVEAMRGVDEGQRHRMLGRMAFKLKRDGWPEDAALPILRGINRKNRPPLPADDVDALAWLLAVGRPKKYLLGEGKGGWIGWPPPRPPSMLDQGCQLVRRLFAEREKVKVQEIMGAAEKEGIPWDTMRTRVKTKMKEELGIESLQQEGIWWWRRRPAADQRRDKVSSDDRFTA